MELNTHHSYVPIDGEDENSAQENPKRRQQTNESPPESGDCSHPKEEAELFNVVKDGKLEEVRNFLKENLSKKDVSTSSGAGGPSTSTDGGQSNDSLATDHPDQKDEEFLSILQVAIMLGDVETVEYLNAEYTDSCCLARDLVGALPSNESLQFFVPKKNAEPSHSEDTDQADTPNAGKNSVTVEVENREESNIGAEARDDKKKPVKPPTSLVNQNEQQSRQNNDQAIISKIPKEKKVYYCKYLKRRLKKAMDTEDDSKIKQLANYLKQNFRDEIDPKSNCSCPKHRRKRTKEKDSTARKNEDTDVLQDSQAHLDACDISTSPCYILATAEEPILSSFRTNDHLLSMAYWHAENRERLIHLAERCSTFAVNVLETCENDKEATVLFKVGLKRKESTSQSTKVNDFEYRILHHAVSLLQKKFVSHPTCQLEVSKLWFGPYYARWMDWSTIRRMYHVVWQAMLTPFIFIVFALKGETGIRKSAKDCWEAPFNRFIYFAASYLFFLVTVITKQYVDHGKNWTAPSVSGYDVVIGIWLVGYICKLVSDFSYKRLWWVTYDTTMIVFFVLGMLTYIVGFGYESGNWRNALLSQGFYSIAITLACMRTLQWLHLNSTLGPLAISFGEMAVVIRSFLVIFAILVISFSAGIYTVYKNFQPNYKIDERQDDFFRSYGETLKILFWALFGHTEANIASVPDDYRYLLGNVTVTSELQDSFTVIVGYILWSFFHIAVVLVLMNMLIAVMTNYYQRIQDNDDVEWKFARTKLQMYYIEKKNTFPPPFNLTYLVWPWTVGLLLKKWNCQNGEDDEIDGEPSHEETVQKLIQRYKRKKKLDETRTKQ